MTRCEKKADVFLWSVIYFLPIICFIIIYFRSGNGDFSTFISTWSFNFVSDIFNQIFTTDFIFPSALVNYISYLSSCVIIHVFFDFIVFIPRLCHNVFARLYHNEK